MALALIHGHTTGKIETIEYLVHTPTETELNDILRMLGLRARDIVRTREPLYQEKYALRKKVTNAQWIKILCKHPILIERPIIVKDGKAIIGRPVERIIEFIKTSS